MWKIPLRDPGTSWSGMQETFSGWLRDLPKPVGVLCSMDGVARRLAATCRSMDLNVPEEVAILGVNDDEFECVVARPNLSSIAIPARRIGYDAAALLENLMAGEPRPQSDITLQPLGVVSRRSTEAEATEDEIVRTALRYIRANYREPIRVDDVADAAGRPRRTLERRFRRALDRTVLDEITRRRIETARRLLVETDLDIGGVAKRSGFSDARRMAVVFRERLAHPERLPQRSTSRLIGVLRKRTRSNELGSSWIAYPSLGSEASSDNSFGNRSAWTR